VREGGRPLKEIRLGPPAPEHCHEMVAYILDSPHAQTKALADFIADLSEGNPLFVSESLSYLHNEDLLFLDEEAGWRWDMEKIRRSDMPTTVVSLFSSKIRRLPQDLINLLEYCACMGNTFSPADLSLIREMTLVETFEMLKPALGQGLLIENKSQLQFVHDKVQEAALSAIAAERRCQIHQQVGNHLLAAVPEGADMQKVDNLFAIVSHLNLGSGFGVQGSKVAAPEPPTQNGEPGTLNPYLLSDLNYHAGNKALDSLATEAANEYFNLSRAMLPGDCWEEGRYDRTFRIYQRAAKTELMCGNYGNSERLLAELLDHAKTDLDKAECLAEQTTSLSSIGNFIKAIETANRGLAYFGKAIPDNPEEADARRRKLMAEIASKNMDVRGTILNMPFTTDRKNKIELAFYSELIPDLYMSGLVPQLYLSAAQSTQHCLAGGMDESVIYSFSIMGLQLGEQEEFEQAFKYEDLARDLSAKYPNTFGATRGMNGIVWCNMHSRSHPKEIVDYCLKSIQCGKNCGDLYNAGLSYGPLMWNLQVQGADLSAIEDYAQECLQFSNRYHLSFSTGLAEAVQAGWIGPMKKDYVPVSMEDKLKKWEEDNHVASAGSYYVHMALAHYYLGEYEKAQEFLEGVRKYLSGLTDNVLKRQWHVFLVLNALKLYEKGSKVQGSGVRGPEAKTLNCEPGTGNLERLMTGIRPLIKKIETWAAFGPLLKPYLAFLYAELARVLGSEPAPDSIRGFKGSNPERGTGNGEPAARFREARSLYLDAISIAHEQNYTLLEGHLNECLGELLRDTGHHPAGIYFAQADRLYRKCRAERKEVNLLERYPEYFEEEAVHVEAEAVSSVPHTLPNLDLDYLMKSSLAISAEIELDALLKKIMNVVIQASGAQHGFLLIEEGGNLFVRAESHIREEQSVLTLNQKLEDTAVICKAIVRYVYRSGEKIIFENACRECTLRDSPDCRDMDLRSLLCLPLIKQSKMIGALYLENRLSASLFTSERSQMTELLTSQAAISLENAALFIERRKAEEALKKSEQHYATTLASIGDAVIAADMTGSITFMNAVAEELTGWTLKDALSKPSEAVFRIINERTRKEVASPIKQVLNKGAIVGLANHTILVRKDGKEVPIDDSGAPIKDAAGKIIGIVLVFRDTTARRQAEREHERLSAIVESTDDAIIGKMLDGTVTSWNKAAEKMYGFTAVEMLGKSVLRIIPVDRRKEFSRILGHLSRGDEIAHHDTVRVRKDGARFDVSVTVAPIKNHYGEIVGASTIARDITGRKKAEEALQASLKREQFLADLVRNASVAMAVGYVDGRLSTSNLAFQNLTGYSEEELRSVTWNAVLTPTEWREYESKKLSELNRTKAPVQYEKEYIRKDGSRVAVELVAHPFFDDAGNISHYYAFVSDITEKKINEERIKASLREKEALLKEIHHRVKNNLQIIYSMLNLQLPQIKDEHAIELFRESQNRVHSMALIHEKLYQSESLARLDLAEYVRSLTANLFLSYGVSERIVEPKIAVENISFDIDTVIPCALIINELVSNSL
ncbi:MAG: PAS domain S-box protein, partial [Desulfobacterales bacterium]|nr:PAS domain S-box protein [Desulfobacterales bacterium]